MTENPPRDEQAERVHETFDSFTSRMHDRLDDETRGSVERLRAAAAAGDAESVRQHMEIVRERHGWLYRELAAHPGVATLLDELALWGF